MDKTFSLILDNAKQSMTGESPRARSRIFNTAEDKLIERIAEIRTAFARDARHEFEALTEFRYAHAARQFS